MIELRSWLVGFADLKGWFLCLVGCVSLTEIVSNERIQTSGSNQEEGNRKNVIEKTEQKNFNKKMSMNSLRKDGVWT